MGAVTSLEYAAMAGPNIDCMILDSPFSNLKTMIKDLAYGKLKIPGFLVGIGLKYMNSQIFKRVKLNLFKLKPIKKCPRIYVPVCFIVGKEDELVKPKRITEMC